MNISRCHNEIISLYGQVIRNLRNHDNTREGIEAVWLPSTTEEQKAAVNAFIATFDFNAPDPDPDKFIDAVAEASSNTGILLVAMRLATAAKKDAVKLKQKLKDHKALPAPQRSVIVTALQQAGFSGVTANDFD